MLPLLSDNVIDVRIHLVVGIFDRLLPKRFFVRRKRDGLSFRAMNSREMHDIVAEQVDDAARVFLTKASEHAVSATRIEWKDCFRCGGFCRAA